jgi:hypothetical protein
MSPWRAMLTAMAVDRSHRFHVGEARSWGVRAGHGELDLPDTHRQQRREQNASKTLHLRAPIWHQLVI